MRALLPLLVLALSCVACDDGASDPTTDAGADAVPPTADASTADDAAMDAAPSDPVDRYYPINLPDRAQVNTLWAAGPDDVWLGTTAGLMHATAAGVEVVSPVEGDVVIRDFDAAGPGRPLAVGRVGEDMLILEYDGASWSRRVDVTPEERPAGDLLRVARRGSEIHLVREGRPLTWDPTGLFGGPTFYDSRDGSLVSFSADVYDLETHMGQLFAATSRSRHRFCDTGGRRWCMDTQDPSPITEPDDFSVGRLRSLDGRLFGLGSRPGLIVRQDEPVWVADLDPAVADLQLSDMAQAGPDTYVLVGSNGAVLAGRLGALEAIDVGGEVHLTAVAATASEGGHEVWIAGADGALLRCVGACLSPAAACTNCEAGVARAAWGEGCATTDDCLDDLFCDPRLNLCADCLEDAHCEAGTCSVGRCR